MIRDCKSGREDFNGGGTAPGDGIVSTVPRPAGGKVAVSVLAGATLFRFTIALLNIGTPPSQVRFCQLISINQNLSRIWIIKSFDELDH